MKFLFSERMMEDLICNIVIYYEFSKNIYGVEREFVDNRELV